MFDRSHDLKVLDSLTEATLDSADGYRRACERAHGTLAVSFRELAADREKVVRDLQAETQRLGGRRRSDGKLLAAAHRMFLTLAEHPTGDEAARAEVHLDGRWSAACGDERLSPETRELIERCRQRVTEGRRRCQEAALLADAS